MNMFKKNGGFTLVELIVVIAILAILAGVAVPAYTGYIAKAEQASSLQTLSAVNTAAQGLAIAEGAEISKIVVSDDGTSVTVTANKVGDAATSVTISGDDVIKLTGTLTFNDSFNGATWTIVEGVGEWKLN